MTEQIHDTTLATTAPRTATPTVAVDTRDEERHLTPPVDIYEKPDALVLLVDMPGVAPEGLDVRLDDDVLTLKGRPEPRPEIGDALLCEFELRPFHRQFQVSDRIDAEGITATMKNGVVTIRLPKATKAQPRQIEVKVAS